MQMYNDNDLKVFEKNIDDLEKKLVDRENEILEPTLKTLKEIEKIVFDFVKTKKRKVYGGTAQNKLIVEKSPKDAFYPEGQLADIDFYSPEPIEDSMELANILKEKGYKHVEAKEAVHSETYTVFAEFMNVADISYVPKNIYHRMPYIEIDGINYTAPSFIMIDMYRILTDPLTSGSFRWKKTFPRIYLLQKFYPFNKATSSLPNVDKIPSEMENQINKGLKSVFNFLQNNDSIIVTGNYAYNYFLKESGILNDKNHSKKYKILEITYFEFTSTNYKDDGKALMDKIKEDNPDIADDINIVEFYPFWMYLGYSAMIKYKEHTLAHIINYNRRCIPIKKIKAQTFKNSNLEVIKNSTINIGSFDFNFLLNLIFTQKYRVNKDSEMYQFRNIMISHLIEIRNYYFKNSKKTMLDDTPFQQFIVECVGETMHPTVEARLVRDKKAKQKKLIIWTYRPEREGIKEPKTTFRFSNSSGNEIHNIKNLKITDVEYIKPEERTRDRDGEEEEEEEEDQSTEDILKEDTE